MEEEEISVIELFERQDSSKSLSSFRLSEDNNPEDFLLSDDSQLWEKKEKTKGTSLKKSMIKFNPSKKNIKMNATPNTST